MSLTMARTPRAQTSRGGDRCGPSIEARSRAACGDCYPCGRLLLAAVGFVLRDEGPQIGDLLVVLDAAERHAGAGRHGGRIADPLLEQRRVPGEVEALGGVGVVEAGVSGGLAAIDPVERGSELYLGVRPDVVAGAALIERLLAGGGILRERGPRRCGNE